MAYAHEATMVAQEHALFHFVEWGMVIGVGIAVYFIYKGFKRI